MNDALDTLADGQAIVDGTDPAFPFDEADWSEPDPISPTFPDGGPISVQAPSAHKTPAEAGAWITRRGYSWATTYGAPTAVSYAFRASAPSNAAATSSIVRTFTQFSAVQIAAVQSILDLWSDVANVAFVRVGSGTGGAGAYSNDASILLGGYRDALDGAAAYAYAPAASATAAASSAGDLWDNQVWSYNLSPHDGQLRLAHADPRARPHDRAGASRGLQCRNRRHAHLREQRLVFRGQPAVHGDELLRRRQHGGQPRVAVRRHAAAGRHHGGAAALWRQHRDPDGQHDLRVQRDRRPCRVLADERRGPADRDDLRRGRAGHARPLGLRDEPGDQPQSGHVLQHGRADGQPLDRAGHHHRERDRRRGQRHVLRQRGGQRHRRAGRDRHGGVCGAAVGVPGAAGERLPGADGQRGSAGRDRLPGQRGVDTVRRPDGLRRYAGRPELRDHGHGRAAARGQCGRDAADLHDDALQQHGADGRDGLVRVRRRGKPGRRGGFRGRRPAFRGRGVRARRDQQDHHRAGRGRYAGRGG